jgi:hypothetical protein
MIKHMGSKAWNDHKGALFGAAIQAIPSLIGLLGDADDDQPLAVKPDYFRALETLRLSLIAAQAQDSTVDWSAAQA